MSPSFRCSTASEARGESQAGTASTVRSFLLVEDPGPWGIDAVSDNRLPVEVKTELAARARRAGVRVLMIRRHGRSSPGELTVFAAFAAVHEPWLETCTVDDPASLSEWTLELRRRFEKKNRQLGIASNRAVEVFTPTAWGEVATDEQLAEDFPNRVV